MQDTGLCSHCAENMLKTSKLKIGDIKGEAEKIFNYIIGNSSERCSFNFSREATKHWRSLLNKGIPVLTLSKEIETWAR